MNPTAQVAILAGVLWLLVALYLSRPMPKPPASPNSSATVIEFEVPPGSRVVGVTTEGGGGGRP